MQPRYVIVIAIGCLVLGTVIGALFVAPLFVEVPAAQKPVQTPKPDLFTQNVQEGNAAMDAGQFRPALAAYDRALAIKFDANVATDRGVCFRELGERDRALTAFEFVTMKEPAHWQARYDKAVLLLEMQRYDDAKREIDVLAREHPTEPAVIQLMKAFTQKKTLPH